MSMNENMSERENDEPLEEPLHCRFLLCEVERTALDDSVVHVSRIIVIIVNILVLELYRLFVVVLSCSFLAQPFDIIDDDDDDDDEAIGRGRTLLQSSSKNCVVARVVNEIASSWTFGAILTLKCSELPGSCTRRTMIASHNPLIESNSDIRRSILPSFDSNVLFAIILWNRSMACKSNENCSFQSTNQPTNQSIDRSTIAHHVN